VNVQKQELGRAVASGGGGGYAPQIMVTMWSKITYTAVWGHLMIEFPPLLHDSNLATALLGQLCRSLDCRICFNILLILSEWYFFFIDSVLLCVSILSCSASEKYKPILFLIIIFAPESNFLF